jgi:hypothetical protein
MNVFEVMAKELEAMGSRTVNFSTDPFQSYGFVLNSGHGTFFKFQRPESLIKSAWSEVFVRKSTVKPHDYSVEL